MLSPSVFNLPVLNIPVLDTPACSTIGTTKQWLQFTSLAGQVVSHPAMLLLLVGLGVMIGMTLGRQRRRRWAVRFGLGFLVAAVVLPVLTTVTLVSLIPADQGQAADAVVILGRGPDLRYLRTAVAADLVKAQRAPMIFVSGGGDAVEMLDILQTHYAVADGVTASLAGEDCSRTTKENALYSAQLLLPQGIKRIILVTDAPHMLRSHLTFRNVGFEVISHPSPFPESFGLQDQMVIALRETAGFITYSLLGRF